MTIGYPPPLIFQPSFRLRNWKSGQSMLGPKWHGAASSATTFTSGCYPVTTSWQPGHNIHLGQIRLKSARCTRWPSKSPISLNLPRLITYHGAGICPMVTGWWCCVYIVLVIGMKVLITCSWAISTLEQMQTHWRFCVKCLQRKYGKNTQHEDRPSNQWDYHLSTSKCGSKTLTTFMGPWSTFTASSSPVLSLLHT